MLVARVQSWPVRQITPLCCAEHPQPYPHPPNVKLGLRIFVSNLNLDEQIQLGGAPLFVELASRTLVD